MAVKIQIPRGSSYKEVAEKANVSESYVYNVISERQINMDPRKKRAVLQAITDIQAEIDKAEEDIKVLKGDDE